MEKLLQSQEEVTRERFLNNYCLDISSGTFTEKTNNTLKVCRLMTDQEVQDNAENIRDVPSLLRLKQSQLTALRKEKREAVRKMQRKNLKSKARASDRPRLVQRPIEGKRTANTCYFSQQL